MSAAGAAPERGTPAGTGAGAGPSPHGTGADTRTAPGGAGPGRERGQTGGSGADPGPLGRTGGRGGGRGGETAPRPLITQLLCAMETGTCVPVSRLSSRQIICALGFSLARSHAPNLLNLYYVYGSTSQFKRA